MLRKDSGKCIRFNSETLDLTSKLTDWLLNHCFFTYLGDTYQQTKGFPMGTNVAPVLANIILGEAEYGYIDTYGSLPEAYVRFIDDTFMVLTLDKIHETRERFAKIFSDTLSLTWTWEFGETIPFLDLCIFMGKKFKQFNILDFKNYQKPYLEPNLTHIQSDYPDTYKFNWVRGEVIRRLRNSRSAIDFIASRNELVELIKTYNYPEHCIVSILAVNYNDRLSFLTQTPKTFNKKQTVLIPHEHGGMELKEIISDISKTLSLDINSVILKGKNLLNIGNCSNRLLAKSDSRI